MTRLSILIPCLRGADQSEETLISVLENRPDDCEVVVAHAQPYDDPYDLADEVRFVHVPGRPGLVELINAGLEASDGDVIHTLACGVTVEEGWTQRVLAHFADPRIGAVSPLLVSRGQPTRIESLGVRYAVGGARISVGHDRPLPQRHKLLDQVLGPTLAAGFYSRELLDALGGLATDIGDELADIDLALSLSELGYRTAVEPACQLQASAEIFDARPSGAFSRGRQIEKLFLRHAAATGGIRAVLAHPLAIALDVGRELGPGIVLKLLGRLVASWEFGTVRSHKLRIAEAQEYLAHEPTLAEARNLLERDADEEPRPQLATARRAA